VVNDDDLTPTLRDLLADDSTWAEPGPDGADRLLAAIRAEGRVDLPPPPEVAEEEIPPLGSPAEPGLPGPGAVPGAPGGPPSPGEAGEPARPAPVVPLADRRRGRALRVLAAAAAVIVVAGAAGVLGAVLGGQDEDDGGHDGREVAIGGGELAPDASAVAYVEELGSGVAIELDVRDLPPTPPGTYYEAWVRNEEVLIPIGTFHMRAGDEVVELWAGVDLDDYPTLTVTLQEEGAGQESSGQVVLRGEIG
jgi:Anti-sigma-K factor rskA